MSFSRRAVGDTITLVAIDVTAQIRYWRDGSVDDLEAAQTLLDVGKIRQAAFFVHLGIEKAVKACVVAATGDLPSRSHDLLFLIQRTSLVFSEEQLSFMGRVQVYCLEGRYPNEWPPVPTAESVDNDLQQARELIQWLTKQLNIL